MIEHSTIQVVKTRFGLFDEFILIQNNVAKIFAVPIFADIIDTKNASLYLR